MSDEYKIIVAGSRTFDDQDFCDKTLDTIIATLGKPVRIVSGCAKGADTCGINYANSRNLPVDRYPADWERDGKFAGFKRNSVMADNANALVAFWDGKSLGTKDMINKAKKKGWEKIFVIDTNIKEYSVSADDRADNDNSEISPIIIDGGSAKKFIELIKRLKYCHYDEVYLANRFFIACYDLAVDSDNGFHYILPIPKLYVEPLYSDAIIINPREVVAAYNYSHKPCDELRKNLKLKPKDMIETVSLILDDNPRLMFTSMLNGRDNLPANSAEVSVRLVDPSSIGAKRIERTLEIAEARVKPDGKCWIVDGMNGLFDRLLESPTIYYYSLPIDEKDPNITLKIGFTRSVLLSKKKVDKFIFTVRETALEHIYLLCIIIEKDGIQEIQIGYVLDYEH